MKRPQKNLLELFGFLAFTGRTFRLAHQQINLTAGSYAFTFSSKRLKENEEFESDEGRHPISSSR